MTVFYPAAAIFQNFEELLPYIQRGHPDPRRRRNPLAGVRDNCLQGSGAHVKAEKYLRFFLRPRSFFDCVITDILVNMTRQTIVKALDYNTRILHEIRVKFR